MSEPLSTTLASWAAGLRYADLPADAVTRAKRLLLDTLAVAWASCGSAGIEPLRRLALAQGGAPEASLWSHPDRVPLMQAVFVNGATAAALDFDSVHDEATVHADIVIVPAALALAEREQLSGEEFLAAYIAGDELMVRLGLAVSTHPGWFYTSVLGVFAAAAAASRALRLSVPVTAAALGIALSRAAGVQQALVERATTKRLQSAFAARDGVEAALLARAGVVGPAAAFEGACAFEALYTRLDHRTVLADLGRDFRFGSLTLKKYASCFCNHAAIEASLALASKVGPQEIEGITVTLSPFMAKLVGAPFAPGDNPQVAAQFSVQYSIASVFERRRFAVEDIAPQAVHDPAVGKLAARVRVEVDPGATGKFVPATVAVRTHAGGELRATADALPGTPAHPLSENELHEKAMSCFTSGARALSAAAARALIGRIERVETLATMDQLWEIR